MARMRGVAAVIAIGLAVSGCLGTALPATPSPRVVVPEDFRFVTDELGLMDPAAVLWSEVQLRSVAERTGMFGLIANADRDDPRIADVEALGGSWVLALCAVEECDISTPDAWSENLADLVGTVAQAPAPASGPPPDTGLLSWVGYVSSVGELAAQP